MVFKDYTPCRVIIKYWLHSPCYTKYPCSLFYTEYFLPFISSPSILPSLSPLRTNCLAVYPVMVFSPEEGGFVICQGLRTTQWEVEPWWGPPYSSCLWAYHHVLGLLQSWGGRQVTGTLGFTPDTCRSCRLALREDSPPHLIWGGHHSLLCLPAPTPLSSFQGDRVRPHCGTPSCQHM